MINCGMKQIHLVAILAKLETLYPDYQFFFFTSSVVFYGLQLKVCAKGSLSITYVITSADLAHLAHVARLNDFYFPYALYEMFASKIEAGNLPARQKADDLEPPFDPYMRWIGIDPILFGR